MKNRKKKFIMIVGPSGSGKSTLAFNLEQKFPTEFTNLISVTTRAKRAGERQNIDYYFIRDIEFDYLKNNGDLVEFIEFDDKKYGLHKDEIERVHLSDKNAIFVVEPNGILQILEFFKDEANIEITKNFDLELIFFNIPERLRFENMFKRGDQIEVVHNRIKNDNVLELIREFNLFEKFEQITSNRVIQIDKLTPNLYYMVYSYLLGDCYAAYIDTNFSSYKNHKTYSDCAGIVKHPFIAIEYDKIKDNHIVADLYSDETEILFEVENIIVAKLYGELRKTYL